MGCVSVCEPSRKLFRDRRSLLVAQALSVREAVLERAAGKVLERHEDTPVVLAVVVEPRDIRVREGRSGARLAFEPGAVGGRREELEGDWPVQLEVVGEPRLGHGASTEPRLEPVTAGEDAAVHRDTVFP